MRRIDLFTCISNDPRKFFATLHISSFRVRYNPPVFTRYFVRGAARNHQLDSAAIIRAASEYKEFVFLLARANKATV